MLDKKAYGAIDFAVKCIEKFFYGDWNNIHGSTVAKYFPEKKQSIYTFMTNDES